ncbi:MAG: hypothetical protein ABI583_01185 [Betaproteobacteria bacterium]
MVSSLFARTVFCVALALITPVGVPQAFGAAQWSATVDGVIVYFGVVPSALARDWLAPHGAERDAHGRNIRSADDHHFLVSIFDAKTERGIDDVEVSATYKYSGVSPVTKVLEPMRIGDTITFGIFLRCTRAKRIFLLFRSRDQAKRARESCNSFTTTRIERSTVSSPTNSVSPTISGWLRDRYRLEVLD